METRDGKWVEAAGLVLVRQRPGSANGVMFISIEDETGVANLVVWTKVFEKYRRAVLGSTIISVRGRIQREGEVVHLIAHQIWNRSVELAALGTRGDFPTRAGRGDEVRNGGPQPDSRDLAPTKVRDIYIPDLHIDRLKVKSRDFQ